MLLVKFVRVKSVLRKFVSREIVFAHCFFCFSFHLSRISFHATCSLPRYILIRLPANYNGGFRVASKNTARRYTTAFYFIAFLNVSLHLF